MQKVKGHPGIYRRDNGRYQVTYRTAAGTQKRRDFDKLSHAVDFKAEKRQEKQRGRRDPSKQTLTDFSDRWLRSKAPDLSPNTTHRYAQILTGQIQPYLGSYPLASLTPMVLDEWLEARLASGAGRRSMAQAVVLLRTILKKAVRIGELETNPALAIDAPKKTKTYVDPLSPVQVEEIRAIVPERSAAMISVMAYAGLRPQECLALEWKHIHDGKLVVQQKLVRGEIIKGAKTTGSVRSVDLLPAVVQDLNLWRMQSGGRTGLIFPNESGEPWNVNSYGSWQLKFVKRTSVTPKNLRHTYASLRIWEGKPITWVSRQMGHTNAATTLNVYSHVMDEVDHTISAEEAVARARGELAVAA